MHIGILPTFLASQVKKTRLTFDRKTSQLDSNHEKIGCYLIRFVVVGHVFGYEGGPVESLQHVRGILAAEIPAPQGARLTKPGDIDVPQMLWSRPNKRTGDIRVPVDLIYVRFRRI